MICISPGIFTLDRPWAHPVGTATARRYGCRDVGIRAWTTRMNDRRDPQPNDLLSFGPFTLLTAERLLKRADASIPLGGRALDILIAVVERAGEVVTHRELISTVWPGVTVEDSNL